MRNADCSIKTIATDGWRDLGSKALKAYCSWEEIVSLFMVCHAKLARPGGGAGRGGRAVV